MFVAPAIDIKPDSITQRSQAGSISIFIWKSVKQNPQIPDIALTPDHEAKVVVVAFASNIADCRVLAFSVQHCCRFKFEIAQACFGELDLVGSHLGRNCGDRYQRSKAK